MRRTWALVLLGAVLLCSYAVYRQTAIARLDGEVRSVRERIAGHQALQRKLAEQSQLLTGTADVAAFVEDLYAIARETAIEEHQVTTSQRQDNSPTGRWHGTPGKPGDKTVRISRLQVVVHGGFHDITAYLRRLEALRQPKQIVRFEMAAEESTLRALLLVDLYLLERPDTNVR